MPSGIWYRALAPNQRTRLYWAGFCLLMLGLYLAAWPLALRFIVLPNQHPDKPGLRLEVFKDNCAWGPSQSSAQLDQSRWHWQRPQSTSLAFGIWRVSAGGRYLLQFSCDDAGWLEIDGKRLIETTGLHRASGNSVAVDLKPGPHLLVLGGFNGPMAGYVDLKVRPPEGAFRPLGKSELSFLDLGNFTTWRRIIDGLETACLAGLVLGLAILLWPLAAWLTARLARRPGWLRAWQIWAVLGALFLALVLGAWPAARSLGLSRLTLPGNGIRVLEFVGRHGQGEVLERRTAPEAKLGLQRAQSSLSAWAVWNASQSGVYRLHLACRDYGAIYLDQKLACAIPPGNEDSQPAKACILLDKGPHLLQIRLDSRDHPGELEFSVAEPGSGGMPTLAGSQLRPLAAEKTSLLLSGVRWAQYLGLAGFSLCLLAALWLGLAPASWRGLAAQSPFGLGLVLVSWAFALALLLRIVLNIDIQPPSWPVQALGLAGLGAGFMGLALAAGRLGSREANPEDSWPSYLSLACLLAMALILRTVFLPNMEYLGDEKDMWHLAINLVRDHIPYLVGNINSLGGRNSAGFLYLLGLPALVSANPIHGALFIVLLNVAAVGMAFILTKRLLGTGPALVVGVLFATSPWAIRFSMNIWPQNLVVFFGLGLCLLLPGWSQKGGWWRSLLVGLCAALLAQLHFGGMLLLGGLGLAAILLGLRLSWGRLLSASAVFVLAWLPHVWFTLSQPGGSDSVFKKVLAQIPGYDLEQLWNVGRLLGGLKLDDPGTMGHLAWKFQAVSGDLHYWGFTLLWVLTLWGLGIWAFRWKEPARRELKYGGWFGFYLWAAVLALLALILLNQRTKMHYVEFLLPWPFVLIGLWAWRLLAAFRAWPGKAALALVLILGVGNCVFFWQWQELLGREGGGGEFKPSYYLQQSDELCRIQTQRPLPDRGAARAFGPS